MAEKSPLKNKTKWELLVPLLGISMLFILVNFSGVNLSPALIAGIALLLVVYVGLVLRFPMDLPHKVPRAFNWHSVGRSALLMAVIILAAVGVMTLVSRGQSDALEGTADTGTMAALLLTFVLGALGLASEASLDLDLFPVFRRPEWQRIVYAITSAFFLALVSLLWGNLAGSLSRGIAGLFGEAAQTASQSMTISGADHPLILLAQFLIGGGLLEELLFRVGIMTLVWKLTRRPVWGIVVSAIAFGFYHISPLSSMAAVNLATPIASVLTSFAMGLYMGLVYSKRGFLTAVAVHGLGDWLIVMILRMAS